MSSMPILSIFKPSGGVPDATELFSEFKRIQTLKKQKAVEEARLGKVENRIKDLSEELGERTEGVTKILSEQAYLSAKDVLEYIRDTLPKFKDPEYNATEAEKDFLKFVSIQAYKEKPAGLLTVYAEIDESGHLVICSNKDACSTHKSHLGMGILRIDPTEFTNE